MGRITNKPMLLDIMVLKSNKIVTIYIFHIPLKCM